MFDDIFVDDGIKRKEVVVNEEPPPKKPNYMFEIINSINNDKIEDLLDDGEYEAAFAPWVVLRWLSMDDDLIEIINYINPFVCSLSKKQLYALLLEVIPKKKRYIRYIRGEGEENTDIVIERVAEYYEVSAREARQYISVMGLEWGQSIVKKFGGFG